MKHEQTLRALGAVPPHQGQQRAASTGEAPPASVHGREHFAPSPGLDGGYSAPPPGPPRDHAREHNALIQTLAHRPKPDLEWIP